MKRFMFEIEKIGRYGNDEIGWSLDPDDSTVVWRKEKKFAGIMQALRWVSKNKKLHCITHHDKLNPYHYQGFVEIRGEFEDPKGLNNNSVGAVFLHVREVRFTDNDEEWGQKQIYYDDQWNETLC